MREGDDIYFQIKPENGEKYWISISCCWTCAISLRSVYRGDFDHLFRFTCPTPWREPQNRIDDYYFCLTNYSDENQTMEHGTTRNLPQLFD